MLTEQTVLLAGPSGRLVATRYAFGVAMVAAVYIGVLVLWGRVISLPARPKLSATVDLVLGSLLIATAIVLWVRRPAAMTSSTPTPRTVSAGGALGFGMISMATNFTTLALLVPAAKVIASSDLGFPGRAVTTAVLVVLAAIPAWLPVALTRVAPGPTARGLDALSRFITRHGRTLVVVVVGALGVYSMGRGVFRLAHL